MLEKFKSMTNKELMDFCDDNNINVKSKGAKPNKTELLAAIEVFMKSDDDIEKMEFNKDTIVDIDDVISTDDIDTANESEEDVEEFLNVEPVEAATHKNRMKETRAEKRKRQYRELMKFRRVVINSNDNRQTKVKNQVHYCTWGNRLLGHHTDRFVLGTPWHVREGALRNLKSMTISKSINDAEGNTVKFEKVPAYIIQELDPLSKDELKRIAKKQIIRESSMENLI